MGYPHSHLAAANVASTDRFLNSVNMKATAYTLDETTIGAAGARHVEVTHTAGDTVDTLTAITITGTNLAGEVITEAILPVANTTVAGTKWFRTVTGAIGPGWVIDAVEITADTIEIGYGVDIALVDGTGTLHSIIVNTTAAGTITLADSSGTIAVLAASVPEGIYEFDALFHGYLFVTLAAASDITILHTGNMPHTYAMA